jgi:hypothetical protein
MVMPFAMSGGNGNSGINIGSSGLISLSFFDENNKEITISKASELINVTVNRYIDQTYPEFQFINSSNMSSTLNYVPSGLRLSGSNVSLHIHIKPENTSSAYLTMLKFGKLPSYNSTSHNADLWDILCPKGLFSLLGINIFVLSF